MRFLVALAAAWLATAAWSGNLTAVRVGVHADYTRLVFQLDGATPYQLVSLQPKDDGTQLLTLSIQGMAPSLDRVPVKGSPHIKGVRVASLPDGGAELRIRLRGDVELKELVLSGPDRIVLDFFAAGSGKGPSLVSLVPPALDPVASTALPPRASDFDEAALEPEPEPRRSIDELHEEAFGSEEIASTGDPELEAVARDAQALAEVAEDTSAVEGLEAEVLGAAEMAPLDDPDALQAEDADAYAGVEIAEVVPEEPASAPAPSGSPAAESGGSGSLLGSPVVLAAIAGLAIVGLLFVLGRRRKSEPEDDVLRPLDAGAPDAAQEGMGASADGAIENLFDEATEAEAQEIVDADAPAPFVAPLEDHDIEPDAIVIPQATSEDHEMGVGHDEPSIAPTPMVAPLAPSEMGQGDVAKMVEEFERRIAHLENRLEEVVDAKERLERQVGAQTEELRVQRAAIARTQRVLRTLARPEDEASEPAPKL